MRRLIRDAIQKLVFPWLTPHPTKTGPEVGFFQKEITDKEYLSMTKRNQVAHNIIVNVAVDALSDGFKCIDPETKEVMPELDEQARSLWNDVEREFIKAEIRARMYGSSGIFIGFDDELKLESDVKYGSRIDYVFAIPREMVQTINPKQESGGQVTFPLELDSYEVQRTSGAKINGRRIIHVQPLSLSDNLEGESALEPVFDELTVLKNADWSVGQNVFRNSAGLTFIIAAQGSNQEQVNRIGEATENVNAKSIITLNPGCSVVSTPTGSFDPTSTYNVLMGQISAGCNIPVSILIGAQSGQGVSENDRRDYADFLKGLQNSELTNHVKRLLTLYQDSGQLKKGKFEIKWNAKSIFLIEESRAKLYDARTEVEKVKEKETRERGALYAARAKYWRGLNEREKEKFEMEAEDKLMQEESSKGESEQLD
ncbi:MAG: DUF1073 domain-containing protein [Euryarchaeota archaeon]|nr:DUF1073 domain-containing protein [Euryarchaeota archaeon]